MKIQYKEIPERNINKKNKKSKFHKFVSKVLSKLYKKKILVVLLFLMILLITTFFNFIKMSIVLGLLLISNILISNISKKIPRYRTSLELIMFSTILSGISYGPKIGAIVGVVFSILYYFAANRMSIYIVVFAPMYAIFGVFVGIINVENILIFGMVCVLLYSIISSILVSLLFNAHIDKAIGFIFINTAFNLVMFKYIAPIIILLM